MRRSGSATRRELLKGLAASVAAPCVIPASVFAAPGRPGANDRIALGVIGTGDRGNLDMHVLMKLRGTRVVAVCDVQRGRREQTKAKVDAFYGNTDCACTPDFRDVVTREDIDAVIIATPDHWHCTMLAWACKYGKDAYCEKPFSRYIREGREAVTFVRRYGRVVQVGNQGRSNPSARLACELVRNGRLGTLKSIEVYTDLPAHPKDEFPQTKPREGKESKSMEEREWDLYVGPVLWRPHPASVRGDFRAGGLEDYGAHVVDFLHRALGLDYTGPVEFIPAPGLLLKRNARAPMPLGTLRYADGTTVQWTRNDGCGVNFVGERGKVSFVMHEGTNTVEPADLAKDPIRPDEIHLYASDHHGKNFLDCVRSRRDPVSDVEVGHRTATTLHIAEIALRLDRALKWDPVREVFPGDAEANRWADAPKRAPWAM